MFSRKHLYGERWRTCPVTGFDFPASHGVWRQGRWVHPIVDWDRAYQERMVHAPPLLDDVTPTRRFLVFTEDDIL